MGPTREKKRRLFASASSSGIQSAAMPLSCHRPEQWNINCGQAWVATEGDRGEGCQYCVFFVFSLLFVF